MAASENFGSKQYKLASRRAVALIADITSRLELSHDVREAAVCFWHQYFATRSFEHSNPFPLICASVSLACKSFDQPRSAQDIIYSSCCSEYHYQLDHEQADETGLAQWRIYINTCTSPQSPILAALLAAEYALLYQINFQLEPITPGRLASLAMWKYDITLGPFWVNELVGMLWNQMPAGRLAIFSCKVVAISCLKLIVALKELQDGKPCVPATTNASWAEDHMDDEAERAALRRCTRQVFKSYGVSVTAPQLPRSIPSSDASEQAHFDMGSPLSVVAAIAGSKVGVKRGRDELELSKRLGSDSGTSSELNFSSESDSDSDGEEDTRPCKPSEAQKSPEDELWDRFFDEDCTPPEWHPLKRPKSVAPEAAFLPSGSERPHSQQSFPATAKPSRFQDSLTSAPAAVSIAEDAWAPSTTAAHSTSSNGDESGQALPCNPRPSPLQQMQAGHALEPASKSAAASPPASAAVAPMQQGSRMDSNCCRDAAGVRAGTPHSAAQPPPTRDDVLRRHAQSV
ncbi:hypothetical protein WJX74_006694 [Apatococcus lobatus]|uniref:Cyclin N-terminal domain-containing protein n=1 Tax=Apatococcus lobatus TaxID=904363 RepID=A0AAW1S2P9_9CHLO